MAVNIFSCIIIKLFFTSYYNTYAIVAHAANAFLFYARKMSILGSKTENSHAENFMSEYLAAQSKHLMNIHGP